jgi:hypothetical protein
MKIRAFLFALLAVTSSACGSGTQQKNSKMTSDSESNSLQPDVVVISEELPAEEIDALPSSEPTLCQEQKTTTIKFDFDAYEVDAVSARVIVHVLRGTTFEKIDSTIYSSGVISLPVSYQTLGEVYLEYEGGPSFSRFISDGSELEVVAGGRRDRLKIISNDDNGMQSAYEQYLEEIDYIDRVMSEFGHEYYHEKLKKAYFNAITENQGNGIFRFVLEDASRYFKPEELLEFIDTIPEPIKSDEAVQFYVRRANALLNLKEGMKFTDFTVEHVYGYDRSMDPQPLKKKVKFSDFVGNGSHVLVHFWIPVNNKYMISEIQQIYAEYKDKGLEVLTLAVLENQPQSYTIETAAELGMDWLHINNCGSTPVEIYGVDHFPYLMLIGPDGTILKRGIDNPESLQEAVAEFIK